MLGSSPLEEKKTAKDLVPWIGRLVFVVGLMISALDHSIGQRGRFEPSAMFILGVVMFIIGLSLYFTSRIFLGRLFSEKIRFKPDHKLITTGPYRHIRHPVYLGEMFYFLSFPIIFSSLYGLLIMLLIVPILVHRIGYEEKALSDKFGKEFENYKGRTWKLVPFIY